MASSSNNDYGALLQEPQEDQLLLQALEESIRFYEEVEVPRISNVSSNAGAGSSRQVTIRQNGTSGTEGTEKYEFIGMDKNGFDRGAGRTWIYPTNYPIRDYQFNIVQCALFKNTLVSLPTGLGKTFIAAVVMYNFYRWFPEGKVLFLAPTRPLVAQQIDSCYRVMGIPKHDTAEMTGQMPPDQREIHWKKCRVFFLTPQSLMSDLMRNSCPVQQIRCIVVDEAHRATGNYAYCQVTQAVLPFNKFFRVLALSATPGNDMDAVQQVIKNLMIEHIEVRDEQSSDTAQFTNERIVETVVVKLEGFHKYILDSYCQILGSYMDLLLRWKLVFGNPRNTSKYALMMSRNKFRSNIPAGMSQDVVRQIEADFFLCMSLSHGLELLCQHGLRNMLRYLTGLLEDEDKSTPQCRARLNSNGRLTHLLTILEEKLGDTNLKEPDLNTSIGAIQTQSAPSVYSHPKMEKLRDVVINHFQTYQLKGEETRVMVFCQYRDTVTEVCHLLARLKPLVKVMSFVGQNAGKSNKGFSQKQQLLIMEKFRRGGYNTLISTSIGEEGLDIGEVDLIVCYDAHASPIRLVQRMGRTGRKRQGRIVMLLTDGKENKKYHQSLCNRKSMNSGLVNSKQFLKFLYQSPRMVPEDLEPECYKMFMSMPKISRDRDVRKMLLSKKSNSSKEMGTLKNFRVEDIDFDASTDLLPETEYLHSMEADQLLKYNYSDKNKIDLSSNLDYLLNDTKLFCVSRSSVANDLQELLEFAARRRCDVPLTQTANLASQICRTELWPSKKRKKNTLLHSKGPQRKKKNQRNAILEPNDKNNKQRRLTNLWTGLPEPEEDFVMPLPVLEREDFVMPLPVLEERENPEVSEEMVDVLSESLIMTEQMITKIKKLEDGMISCCRLSKMFQNSEFSSFLLNPAFERGNDSSLFQDIFPLPDSGYFDELLNSEVWENFSERKGDTSPTVSQKRRRRIKNEYKSDEYLFNHNSFSDSSPKVFNHKQQRLLNSYGYALANDLFSNTNSAMDTGCDVTVHPEDKEPNFDIGITQLLNLTPDLSQDSPGKIVNEQTSPKAINFSGARISPNLSQDPPMEIVNEKTSPKAINFSGAHISSNLSQDPPERVMNDQTPPKETGFSSVQIHPERLKEDCRNLSHFVDEAILKWLGSSEDELDFPSCVENAEQKCPCPSEAPVSPIISSQRKKLTFGSLSSSTPIPDKKGLLPLKNNREKTNTSTNLVKNVPQQNESDVFHDTSSLDDFEISDTVKPKNISDDKINAKIKKINKDRPDLPAARAAFIVDEAEESWEDRHVSSDEENTSGLDELDDSFVDDEERTVNESVDIQAHYLRSVRSPVKGQGHFKIKEVQNFQVNVYSQALTEEELHEDYEQDSFCVSSTDNEDSDNAEDTLDIIEAVLKKKRKSSSILPQKKKSRKRIRVVSSSSDEGMAVLKNLQPTQFVQDSPTNKDVQDENDKKDSRPNVSEIRNNKTLTSNCNIDVHNANNPTNYWDDDDCILIDDDFIESVVKHSESSCVNKLNEKSSRNEIVIDDKSEASPIYVPKNVLESKDNVGSSGARKQLKFCGNNPNKKTLMTHFFQQSKIDKKTKNFCDAATEGRNAKLCTSNSSKGMRDNGKNSNSRDYVEDIRKKEDLTNSDGKLTVITSTRQVVAAPEIITALKSQHQMFVLVHSIQVAHFILSPHVGVVRATLKDVSGSKAAPILDVAKNLTAHFQQAYILVEYTPSETDQRNTWPIDLSCRLQTTGVKVLYSHSKASTADLLANLCCREFSCGRTIKLPRSIKDCMAITHFLEELPGVNTAMAFDLCCRFETIGDFISTCKSVPEIRQMLGVNRETARKIYFLLRDVL